MHHNLVIVKGHSKSNNKYKQDEISQEFFIYNICVQFSGIVF